MFMNCYICCKSRSGELPYVSRGPGLCNLPDYHFQQFYILQKEHLFSVFKNQNINFHDCPHVQITIPGTYSFKVHLLGVYKSCLRHLHGFSNWHMQMGLLNLTWWGLRSYQMSWLISALLIIRSGLI
jgi:hypothetical protein